jgi:hypothetical protein
VHTGTDPAPAETTVEHVALLYALEAEAMPLVERLGLVEQPAVDPCMPQRHFSGRVGTLAVDLLINGRDPRCGTDRVGTDAATLAAFMAIRKLAPDLIINAGTAGGFESRGGSIGAIYVSVGNLLYHDRHIPIPGFELQARGAWPATPAPNLMHAIGAKPGIVTTGNSLNCTAEERAFFEHERVAAKDMEACAIAQVCAQCGVPFVAVKSITDATMVAASASPSMSARCAGFTAASGRLSGGHAPPRQDQWPVHAAGRVRPAKRPAHSA